MPNTQSELTDNNRRAHPGAATIDRTGVQSSLPFSRSIHFGHSTRNLSAVPHRELVSHLFKVRGSILAVKPPKNQHFQPLTSPSGVTNVGV